MSLNIGRSNDMDNLELYNKVREVPKEAIKPIMAGRLKGMSDINPMWRIKTLTSEFGACGIGWYFEITDTKIDVLHDTQETVATVQGNLYVKVDGEWSKPIYGIGGAKMASMERNGLYVDDECFKKASTDALSVACKNLGIGADVYWDKDSDKYNDTKKDNFNSTAQPKLRPVSTSNSKQSTDSEEVADALERKKYRQLIVQYAREHKMTMSEIENDHHVTNDSPLDELKRAYKELTTPPEEQTNIADEFAAIDEDVPF